MYIYMYINICISNICLHTHTHTQSSHNHTDTANISATMRRSLQKAAFSGFFSREKNSLTKGHEREYISIVAEMLISYI